MRVLVLYAHPAETSFCAEINRQVAQTLQDGGHVVDMLDLNLEKFNPVLSRGERLGYHAIPDNRAPVVDYVRRLQAADALVIVTPIWNFGFPAILKGFFDRVFLPGVSFEMKKGKARPCLHNLRRLLVIATYGGTRWRARLMGDPPRLIVKRLLRATIRPGAAIRYLGLYDMNRADAATRRRYLQAAGDSAASMR
ncbi:NAD(P)H-dependent oxidoreductase [Candidatus Raskinella chloraquaticus]|uniref:NAD(P)H dehydrogenase n=1 Tax=Candidatus Raskinella chloraquaticus TaxID=1951219 RepID=A0A1W9HUW3_9HYPH|nr:MAG: NAD(P)H dehydrogenase [Proteobacteria bacterium SG_bin8]